MPNSDPRDRFFYPHQTVMKDSILCESVGYLYLVCKKTFSHRLIMKSMNDNALTFDRICIKITGN